MSPPTDQPNKLRLPTHIKPTHYNLTIKTDLSNQTFSGLVKINLDILKETSEIVLNVAESLNISKVIIYSDTLKSKQVPTKSTFDKTHEQATYTLPHPLPSTSSAQITLAFNGNLAGNGGAMGYCKCVWKDGGEARYYAVTHFEPIDARRAFPCWDEPQLKATFSTTLISRADTINLANMPVKSEAPYNSDDFDDYLESPASNDDDDAQWKITTFETTPLMSTYIVAFANGPFKYLEKFATLPLSGKSVPIRIYATEDIIHQAQFALDVTASVLPLYEKVFDIEYPLPKLDTVVCSELPGAMENWGLITSHPSAALLDPQSGELSAKKTVASVMSHEVAHMWFGNITTMEWWDYLYLNEGFATLMGEVIVPGSLFPEWQVNVNFLSAHLGKAMSLDAKLSSHPIEVPCPDASFIHQIFDDLSYSKAASVLRMLSAYVGEDQFLKGVSTYLKNKLYGTSVTSDLWDGIGKVTGKNIASLMDNWITKTGFPVLSVTETDEGINVRQDRFLETGLGDAADNETIWNVPLGIATVDANGTVSIDNNVVLEQREQFFSLPTGVLFKLNAGTTGIYRVLYTPKQLARIAEEAVKVNSVFTLSDRIGLVQDAFALAKAGLAKLSSALALVDTLKNETENFVWDSIASSLTLLVNTWWEHQDIVDKLNAFRRVLFHPLVDKLGYEYSDSDSPDVSALRTLAIGQSALAEDESVLKELKKRFDHFMETGDDSKIPADLQKAIYRVAVQKGGRKEYDAVVGISNNSKTPTSHTFAIVALGASEDPKLIDETLKTIKDGKLKDLEYIYYFSGLSANPKARRTFIKFFKDEFDSTIYKRFNGSFIIPHLIKLPFSTLATKEDLDDLQQFFKDKDTAQYSLALAQTADTIKSNIAFRESSTDDLSKWLEEWQ